MLLFLDRHNGVPVYRQIIEQVRLQIASGTLTGGDELPSTRALSAELGLNPMTVSKAYSTLEREGVLERRPGLPLVVALSEEEQSEEAKLAGLRRALDPAVRMAAQLNLPAEQVLETLKDLLAHRESKGVSR